MENDCKMIEQAAQQALSVRTRSSVQNLPKIIGPNFVMIREYIENSGEQMAGAPYIAYYNMDMQDLDIEIGIPSSKALPDKDDIKTTEIPAGKYATVIHVGPFDKMEPTYNALNKWVTDNGYETTGIAYELYIDDPAITPMEELKTQIMFPLK